MTLNNSELRTLLIIYPHWHPANLAGVHRPRLVGNYLTGCGWKPRVITVEEKYFEEKPDPGFAKTFSPDFEVTRVNAFRATRPRIIGDIGLRAFFHIRKQAIRICREEQIDFVWIPIPSFYMALMGRVLLRKTGIPFGIDYIDPWVHNLSNQRNLRSIISQWIARILEPVAVKRAALITGVSEAYYMPVLQRNKLLTPNRRPPIHHAAFPFGFDPDDHKIKIENLELPWGHSSKKIWLYAGAFLPNSHLFIDTLFRILGDLRLTPSNPVNDIRLYFLGTGPYPSKSISEYAKDHGIREQVVEVRERFPYLHILNYLSAADTVMIIGSTEKHYTASKTYQALLSGRPVFSILHKESQALKVLRSCDADRFTARYDPGMSHTQLEDEIKETVVSKLSTDQWDPQLAGLEPYSAKAGAQKLVECISDCL